MAVCLRVGLKLYFRVGLKIYFRVGAFLRRAGPEPPVREWRRQRQLPEPLSKILGFFIGLGLRKCIKVPFSFFLFPPLFFPFLGGGGVKFLEVWRV